MCGKSWFWGWPRILECEGRRWAGASRFGVKRRRRRHVLGVWAPRPPPINTRRALTSQTPPTPFPESPGECVFKLRQLAPTFCEWRRVTRRRRRVPARRPPSRCRLAARSCGLSLDCQQSPVAAGRRRRRRPNTKTIDIDCQLHQRPAPAAPPFC